MNAAGRTGAAPSCVVATAPGPRPTYPLDVFIGLNGWMRRQRRRLTMLAVMLALAGTVVVAHAAMGHDHMSDVGEAVVMCLAVAETAVVAVGVALALGAWMRPQLWVVEQLREPEPRFVPAAGSAPARAGPPLLQVFRL